MTGKQMADHHIRLMSKSWVLYAWSPGLFGWVNMILFLSLRQETDHLFDLCKRFDVRFMVVRDRWDKDKFRDHTVEDLKERYYSVVNSLAKVNSC